MLTYVHFTQLYHFRLIIIFSIIVTDYFKLCIIVLHHVCSLSHFSSINCALSYVSLQPFSWVRSGCLTMKFVG